MYICILLQKSHDIRPLDNGSWHMYFSRVNFNWEDNHSTMSRDKLGWLVVVAAHFALYILNIIGFISIILYEPWYFTVLVGTFFMSPAMAGIFCVFTNMENYYRGKLGWAPIEDDSLSFFLRWLRKRGHIIKLY